MGSSDEGKFEAHERSFREGFRNGWTYNQTRRLTGPDAEDEAWKYYRSGRGDRTSLYPNNYKDAKTMLINELRSVGWHGAADYLEKAKK